MTLDRARCLFAALWAGLAATPMALLVIAGNPRVTPLMVAGAAGFVFGAALAAFVATGTTIRIVGTLGGLHYCLALLLADAIFAGFVAAGTWVVVAVGTYLDDPTMMDELAGAAVLSLVVLFWAFVAALCVAVPCSLVGAAMFQLLCRSFEGRRARS